MLPSFNLPGVLHHHHLFPYRQFNYILPTPLPPLHVNHYFPNIPKMSVAKSLCKYPFHRDPSKCKRKRLGSTDDSTFFLRIFNLQPYLPSLRPQNLVQRKRNDSLQFLAICHQEILDA